MLLSCLNGWSQSNSPTGGQTDSVFIHIDYIKLANQKLIENKYNKQIIVEQDSLINLHKMKYNALQRESSVLQAKLFNSEQVNKDLNKSIVRIENKNKVLGGIAVGSIIAFVVCIILK